jgi:RNA polymerase sigma-70 factor (ECF subfamily)
MTLSGKKRTAVKSKDDGSEPNLIHRARQGDAATWEMLVRQHQEPTFRLAYLILGDAADAEEIAQEAFVQAFLSLDNFDEQRPFRPWILQITRNLARNRRRGLGRYWVHVKRWWQQQPVSVAEPADQAHTEARLLWQAVSQLKPAWQEVIYLRYFLEMSETETAATLDIAPGTVKSRLHRALQALKWIIEQDFVELSA